MTNRNKNKKNASTDSPSKEPLMSPARGISKNKNAKLKAECTVPSPNHARYNASFKSTSSSPTTSPRHHLLSLHDDQNDSCDMPCDISCDLDETVTVSTSDTPLSNSKNCQVIIERSPSPSHSHAVSGSPASHQALSTSLAGSHPSIRESSTSIATTNKLSSTSPQDSTASTAKLSPENIELSPTRQQRLQQVEKKDVANPLAALGDHSLFVAAAANGKQPQQKGNKKWRKDKHRKSNGPLKATHSDTVLMCNGHQNPASERQAHSASSLQPLMVDDPRFREYLYATGTVKRGNNWSGEQMRADMVDLSERYAQPNTILSLGIVAMVVGSVSLILSFSSAGMRLWSLVGCVALGIGAILIVVGSLWYYARSRTVYVCGGDPDVEIKVVSGAEMNTGKNSTVPGHKITGV